MTTPSANVEDRKPALAECPKCGVGRKPDENACSRCGLVFANWTPEMAAAQPRLDERGEALWRELEQNWQDDTRHDAFLKHCSISGTLAPAGRRYRERLHAHPRDEVATRMQQKVLAMATAQLGPLKQNAPGRSFVRSSYFWMILMIGAVGGMLAGLVFRR